MAVGLKGHVMSPAFPEDYSSWQKTDLHDLIDAELIERADRQERRQGDHEARQGRRLDRDRDRLRPRGRADRPRGARARCSTSNPGVADERASRAPAPGQARPLLGADQGRDRARLLEPRRALLRPRLRRRRAPGHRPDLGRDADPRGLARDAPLRLQLPLGRPRAEPDPGADRRARARAPRPRAQALLGAVREVRAPRRLLRGPPRDRQVLGARPRRGRARGHQEPRRGQRDQRAQATRASRRPRSTPPPSRPTPPAGSGSPRRARCGSPRTSTWTASSPTRAPTTRSTRRRSTQASWSRRWSGSPTSPRRRPARRRRSSATRGKKETTDHPPIYPTQAVNPERLEGPKRRVYELVVAPLPRHLLAADDHRVDARRHRGRLGELLRARLGRRRPRLRRDLHLRALGGRGDPEARGGPGARPRRRAVDHRQGDPAAVADQPGQADRDDGGARPGHQGDARRHHPEALLPRLRVRATRRSPPRPGSRCTRPSTSTCRGWRRRR